MVSASWGGKLQERLEFLAPTPEVEMPANSKFTKADLATMNAMMKMAGKK